ncbi:MAG: MotA/TolQ/ExbB proton channel family protein [Candidatus Krumholzibacteriota bacterium]|nr:MotA/TolQ/ExbB proton channel family protein [Candidatus Krumholzibacteriota bacterium]
MGYDGMPLFLQMSGSFTDLIANTGTLAKTILALLLVLSVVSWTIIFEKIRFFRKASKQSGRFRRIFEEERSIASLTEKTKGMSESPEAAMAGYIGKEIGSGELSDMKNLDSYIDAGMDSIISDWESYLIFLSTTASVSPFLGLLGTVWGIMSSFLSMGVRGSANLYVIGPGIADALITTIFGLGAAIPAVIGYNYILRVVRRKEEELSSFSVRLRSRILDGRYSDIGQSGGR